MIIHCFYYIIMKFASKIFHAQFPLSLHYLVAEVSGSVNRQLD